MFGDMGFEDADIRKPQSYRYQSGAYRSFIVMDAIDYYNLIDSPGKKPDSDIYRSTRHPKWGHTQYFDQYARR